MNLDTSQADATAPLHLENSTDATRGEPLAMRAQKRKLELVTALELLPADAQRARADIQVVLSTFDALLTGDVDHLSGATAADLSRLLENSKHLAEVPAQPAADKIEASPPVTESAVVAEDGTTEHTTITTELVTIINP